MVNELNQYTRMEESGETPFVLQYDASGNGRVDSCVQRSQPCGKLHQRGRRIVVECGYNSMGRRYMKKVTVNGTVASHELYLYRGYLQLAVLDMLDNWNVLRTLLWDPLEPVATRPLALVQAASLYCYNGLQQECDGSF